MSARTVLYPSARSSDSLEHPSPSSDLSQDYLLEQLYINPTDTTSDLSDDAYSLNYTLCNTETNESPSTSAGQSSGAPPPQQHRLSPTPVSVPAKRPRGRPRKHPIVVPDPNSKPAKSRSKTGCLTCRSRKKKCDETKPVCKYPGPRRPSSPTDLLFAGLNCQKNNVVCQGYPSPEVWQSGRHKQSDRSSSHSPSATAHPLVPNMPMPLPATIQLPTLINGVETHLDKALLDHFTHSTSRVLTLYSRSGNNPFLDIIIPMAMVRPGLMHAVLSLAGSHICTRTPDARIDERRTFHFGCALRDLSTDRRLATGAVDDGIIAQSVILLLKSIVAGEASGEYRAHMNAGRHLLINQRYPNQDFRRFLIEFFIYHDVIKSLTSLERQPAVLTVDDFQLPLPARPMLDTAYIGVFDGLFPHFARITRLRDRVRALRLAGGMQGDPRVLAEGTAIDAELRRWVCSEARGGSRFAASQLYCKCAWIYLHRTVMPSVPSAALGVAVEEALELLRRLAPDSSTQAILAVPLFLLGCASFEPRHRVEVERAFATLAQYKQCGSIGLASRVVQELWKLMDRRDERSWDWELLIESMGLDFLVT